MLRPLEISEVATNTSSNGIQLKVEVYRESWTIILGISKALISHDDKLKKNLKKDKLTTRDSRVVERKNTVTEKLEEASFQKIIF